MGKVIRGLGLIAVVALLAGCAQVNAVGDLLANGCDAPEPPPPPRASLPLLQINLVQLKVTRPDYVWTTPDHSGQTVARVLPGDIVGLVGKVPGGWMMIEVDGQRGYIDAAAFQ